MIDYNLPPNCRFSEPLHTLIGVLSVYSCLDDAAANSAHKIQAAQRAWWRAQELGWRADLLAFLKSEVEKPEEAIWAQPLREWCNGEANIDLHTALQCVSRRCL